VHQNFSKLILSIVLLLAAVGGGCATTEPTQAAKPGADLCEVQGAHDGDTVTCKTERLGLVHVRFAGIDAPETGQAYWRVSREHFKALMGGQPALRCYKTDRYSRQVCRIYVDGKDIAASMIEDGMAWHSTRYAAEQTPEERVLYAEAERTARAAKRGLWAEPDPQPPWECRRAREAHQKCR